MSVSTTSAVPAPWVLSPTFEWDGDDGKWSSFAIEVGTPPQSFRILPSTMSSESWVPIPAGCEGSLAGIADCGNLRGVDSFDGKASLGFQTNASSTWDLIGIYELAAEQNLWGTTGNPGYYGYDTVALEKYGSGATADLKSQTVAGVVTWNAWLGVLGLGTAEANFDVEKTSNPSLMSAMRSQNYTPGLSFGYTAGASYANGGIPGSLIFGGYDKARFKASDLSFPINGDKNKTLPLSIESIVVDNAPAGTMSLTSGDSIITTIDSTTGQLWLPQSVCDLFAQAFGLRYDTYTGLYLVNNTMHKQLMQLNPSVTFTVGSTSASSDTTNIVLPYAAFDLQAGIPWFNFTTNYFPLRVAANASQQVLGRAFLQEAYMFVDWERNNFTIGQAIHQNSTTNIVPVLSPSYISSTDTSSLSTAAVAGIAVGVGGATALIIGLILFFIIRSRRRRKGQPHEKLLGELSETSIPPPEAMSQNVYELQEGENSRHELEVSKVYAKFAPAELQGEAFERELEGDGERLGKPQQRSSVYEMP